MVSRPEEELEEVSFDLELSESKKASLGIQYDTPPG